jgi:hypothetical protein
VRSKSVSIICVLIFIKTFIYLFIEMDKPGKACADQIRTVDKTRIVKILGEISSTTMKQIENSIMIHLDIR